jgi:hypothetical protein
MPVAMALGQAAGVCAALASRYDMTIRAVPFNLIRSELLRQGAILEI